MIFMNTRLSESITLIQKLKVQITELQKEKAHIAVSSHLEGKTIVKEIYVKNKLYNIVIK